MTTFDDDCQGIKVYRFQPCYEAGGGLRADKISPETLWFSTSKNLNDPMDIDHPLDDLMRGNGGDSPVLRDMAKVMYAPGQNQYPRELITEDLLRQIQHWSVNGGHSLDICHEFRERLLQLGVACFTPNCAAFDFEARRVNIFAEEPKREFQLTRKGYEGVWSQKFAFVSERDFTIAHKPLEVFNPTMQKSKSLRFESIDVKVEAGYKKEELLDEVKAQESYFKRDYLYCFLAFVAGFLVSKLRLRLRFGEKKSPFCQKVQNTASLEALSVLLILSDTQKYDSIVQKIETKELTSLRKAKRLICG